MDEWIWVHDKKMNVRRSITTEWYNRELDRFEKETELEEPKSKLKIKKTKE